MSNWIELFCFGKALNVKFNIKHQTYLLKPFLIISTKPKLGCNGPNAWFRALSAASSTSLTICPLFISKYFQIKLYITFSLLQKIRFWHESSQRASEEDSYHLTLQEFVRTSIRLQSLTGILIVFTKNIK